MEKLTELLNALEDDWALRTGPGEGWILDLGHVVLLYDCEERLVGEYYPTGMV